MNEVEFHNMEEQANAGRALIDELCEWAGIQRSITEAETIENLSRWTYKSTDCGAWLNVDGEGLHLGSIVEGSDVDCSTHTLDWVSYLRMDEGDLKQWVNNALEEIEAEATFLWDEWNREPEDGDFIPDQD